MNGGGGDIVASIFRVKRLFVFAFRGPDLVVTASGGGDLERPLPHVNASVAQIFDYRRSAKEGPDDQAGLIPCMTVEIPHAPSPRWMAFRDRSERRVAAGQSSHPHRSLHQERPGFVSGVEAPAPRIRTARHGGPAPRGGAGFLVIRLGVLAETEGFEPSIPLTGYDDLANRCLQPLGHVSGRRCR